MDIFDDEALRRPTIFANNLKRLPTELVHKVLDDLPLNSILQVLAHKNEHLNHCVTTHRFWGRLFNSVADVNFVIDHYILYYQLRRFSSTKATQKKYHVFLNYSDLKASKLKPFDVRHQIHGAIANMLPSTSLEISVLQKYSSVQYPGNDADLRVRWDWVKEAKRSQNRAKSQQLTLAADLIAQHPQKLMIKKPTDPSQGPPRNNLAHIEFRLRVRAAQALRNRNLKITHRDWVCNCPRGMDNIELIPYDRYLEYFLDILKRYPIDNQDLKQHFQVQMVLTSSEKQKRVDSVADVVYPATVLADIQAVVDGLAFVYTGPPHLPVVERVDWGLKFGQVVQPPKFELSPGGHYPKMPMERRCGVNRYLTHDDKEYEWLQLFLKVVTWMEEKFGAVEIPPTDEVGAKDAS